MKKTVFALTTALASTVAVAAYAAPVTLTYEGVVSSTDLANSNVGDAFSISMVFDNGGTSLASQSWDASHFVSVTSTTSSGYSVFGDTLMGGFATVQTDAAGLLSVLNISPIEFSGSDVNGQTFFEIYLNSHNRVLYYTDALGAQTGDAIGAETPPNLSNTTISISTVPLPAALPLLLAGLGLLGYSGRRKAA